MQTENDFMLAARALCDSDDTDETVKKLASDMVQTAHFLSGFSSVMEPTFARMVSRLASLGLTAQLLNEIKTYAPRRDVRPRFCPVTFSRGESAFNFFGVHDTITERVCLFYGKPTARDVSQRMNANPDYAQSFEWRPVLSTDLIAPLPE